MISYQNGSDLHVFPPVRRDYISPRARKIIFWSVVGTHIALIVIPLLLYAIIQFIKPKELQVINVSLFSDLPFDHHTKSVAPDPNNPNPTDSLPPAPGKLDPLPPEEPEPAEEQAPAIKETPKPKEAPKPKPTKETTPSPDAHKPKPKPKTETKAETTPKQKKLTAEDIRKSATVVKNTKPKQNRGQNGEFFNNFAKNLNGIKIDPNARPGGGTNGGIGTKGDPSADMEYFGRVGAFLKSRWQQPSRALMGNVKPSVNIRIRVDEKGQVVAATIERRSNISLMDASVERLLAEVKALPVPPRAMEFTVTMSIEDD